MTNRTTSHRPTRKPDAKSNPRWLTIWLDQLPHSYRWPSYSLLRARAVQYGWGTDAEAVKAMLIDAVSKDVRRETLRLYGATHPQADPNYMWTPN
jgi:hypothetical protein